MALTENETATTLRSPCRTHIATALRAFAHYIAECADGPADRNFASRLKAKRAPSLGRCRRPTAKPLEQAHCNVHELIIAGYEPILGYPNIVFDTGTHSVSPTFQRPLHYL
jgi:hypothetical protein